MNGFRLGKRALVVLLCLIAVLSMLPVFTAAAQADDITGHWAEADMRTWIGLGFLNGQGNGVYSPDALVTRAELMALVNRAFGLTDADANISQYTDVAPDDWFYNDVAVAVKAGYVGGTSATTMEPLSPINREQAMKIIVLLSKAGLSEANNDILAQVKDRANISDWAEDYVATSIMNGLIAGSGNGEINPRGNMTRAETITALERIRTGTRVFSFEGVYSVNAKTVIVSAPGVTLKDMAVEGDVIISEAVGNGVVYLDNVTIGGKLDVRGGTVETIEEETPPSSPGGGGPVQPPQQKLDTPTGFSLEQNSDGKLVISGSNISSTTMYLLAFESSSYRFETPMPLFWVSPSVELTSWLTRPDFLQDLYTLKLCTYSDSAYPGYASSDYVTLGTIDKTLNPALDVTVDWQNLNLEIINSVNYEADSLYCIKAYATNDVTVTYIDTLLGTDATGNTLETTGSSFWFNASDRLTFQQLTITGGNGIYAVAVTEPQAQEISLSSIQRLEVPVAFSLGISATGNLVLNAGTLSPTATYALQFRSGSFLAWQSYDFTLGNPNQKNLSSFVIFSRLLTNTAFPLGEYEISICTYTDTANPNHAFSPFVALGTLTITDETALEGIMVAWDGDDLVVTSAEGFSTGSLYALTVYINSNPETPFTKPGSDAANGKLVFENLRSVIGDVGDVTLQKVTFTDQGGNAFNMAITAPQTPKIPVPPAP